MGDFQHLFSKKSYKSGIYLIKRCFATANVCVDREILNSSVQLPVVKLDFYLFLGVTQWCIFPNFLIIFLIMYEDESKDELSWSKVLFESRIILIRIVRHHFVRFLQLNFFMRTSTLLLLSDIKYRCNISSW